MVAAVATGKVMTERALSGMSPTRNMDSHAEFGLRCVVYFIAQIRVCIMHYACVPLCGATSAYMRERVRACVRVDEYVELWVHSPMSPWHRQHLCKDTGHKPPSAGRP